MCEMLCSKERQAARGACPQELSMQTALSQTPSSSPAGECGVRAEKVRTRPRLGRSHARSWVIRPSAALVCSVATHQMPKRARTSSSGSQLYLPCLTYTCSRNMD